MASKTTGGPPEVSGEAIAWRGVERGVKEERSVCGRIVTPLVVRLKQENGDPVLQCEVGDGTLEGVTGANAMVVDIIG